MLLKYCSVQDIQNGKLISTQRMKSNDILKAIELRYLDEKLRENERIQQYELIDYAFSPVYDGSLFMVISQFTMADLDIKSDFTTLDDVVKSLNEGNFKISSNSYRISTGEVCYEILENRILKVKQMLIDSGD